MHEMHTGLVYTYMMHDTPRLDSNYIETPKFFSSTHNYTIY